MLAQKRVLIHLLLAAGLILTGLSVQRSARADDPIDTPPGLTASTVDFQVGLLGTHDQEAWEWEVIRLVNEERAKPENGSLPPLKFNADLRSAARAHDQDMANDDYFAHDSYNFNGSSWSYDKAWSDRINDYYSGSSLAENIAAGHDSPEAAMSTWMNSEEGHRDNILSNNREIGVGYYYATSDAGNIYCPAGCDHQYSNGPFYHYWTQDFGSRSGVYPVMIDSEAYSTTSCTVDLYVYGPGDVQQMRFSNDNATWSDWQNYDATPTWTLAASSSGTLRTTYAQVKNGTQTFEAADDIYYQGPDPTLATTPPSVSFLLEEGSDTCLPSTHTIQVYEANGCTLEWSSSEDSPWFQANDGAEVVAVSCVDSTVAGYTAGEYTGELTVTAPDTENSPQTVAVKLVVAEKIHNTYLPQVARDDSTP